MNFNDNFHGSNFHIEENEILNINLGQLKDYLNENLLINWKGCPFCQSEHSPIALVNEDTTPSIIESPVISNNHKNAVWSFVLQCFSCGFLYFVHTEQVRQWLKNKTLNSLSIEKINQEDHNE